MIELTNNRENRTHLESEHNDESSSNTLEGSVAQDHIDQEQPIKHQVESLDATSKHKVIVAKTHKPNESKAGVLAALMAKVGETATKESIKR